MSVMSSPEDTLLETPLLDSCAQWVFEAQDENNR